MRRARVGNLENEDEKGDSNSSGKSCGFDITGKKATISRKSDFFHNTTDRYDELRQTFEQGMDKIRIPEAKCGVIN